MLGVKLTGQRDKRAAAVGQVLRQRLTEALLKYQPFSACLASPLWSETVTALRHTSSKLRTSTTAALRALFILLTSLPHSSLWSTFFSIHFVQILIRYRAPAIMIVEPQYLEAMKTHATSSVAPLPTVIPGTDPIYVRAGDVGNRTLW